MLIMHFFLKLFELEKKGNFTFHSAFVLAYAHTYTRSRMWSVSISLGCSDNANAAQSARSKIL